MSKIGILFFTLLVAAFANSGFADATPGSFYCKPIADEPPKAFLSPISCGKAAQQESYLCRQQAQCAFVGAEKEKQLQQAEKQAREGTNTSSTTPMGTQVDPFAQMSDLAKQMGAITKSLVVDEMNWLPSEVTCKAQSTRKTAGQGGIIVACPTADQCKSANVDLDLGLGTQAPIAVVADPNTGLKGGPAPINPDSTAGTAE